MWFRDSLTPFVPLSKSERGKCLVRFPINKHSCRISDIISCGPRASEGKRVSARSKKFSRVVATKKNKNSWHLIMTYSKEVRTKNEHKKKRARHQPGSLFMKPKVFQISPSSAKE